MNACLRPTSAARVGNASGVLALLSLLVALAPLLEACGRPAAPPVSHASTGKRVDPATAATVTGRVTLIGSVSRIPPIVMSSDAFCGRANPGQPTDDSVIVGAEGALQNVFVYVSSDLSAYAFDPPAQPARVEQKGCRFSPHVLGVRVGQPLELANADQTLHNIHAVTKVNDDFNLGMTPGTVMTRTFLAPETMIALKCEVHSWMTAYAGVMSHPYFAVTDADGRFALKGLPPGEYDVAAWHERFGTRTERVTVGPRETKEIAFTFNAR